LGRGQSGRHPRRKPARGGAAGTAIEGPRHTGGPGVGKTTLVNTEARYGQINAFAWHLAENDVTILKFYLHISKKEQKARLQARLAGPTKRWKFNFDDLAERKRWDD
jgi:hypothetical protein